MNTKEALKNVNDRMKKMSKYEDIWTPEFIVIKHLKAKLKEEKKYTKKLKAFIKSSYDTISECNCTASNK